MGLKAWIPARPPEPASSGGTRWPGGVPADPAAALRAADPRPQVFEGNLSSWPEWLCDRNAVFHAPSADRRMAALLRKRRHHRKDFAPMSPQEIRHAIDSARGHGRWRVEPSGVIVMDGEVLARMSPLGGPPVLDVKLDYLSLALALFADGEGPVEFTWGGIGAHFWKSLLVMKSGAIVGAIAAYGRDQLCPPVSASQVICGSQGDPPEYSPSWPGAEAKLRRISWVPEGWVLSDPNDPLWPQWDEGRARNVERIATELGGRRSAGGGVFTWEAPTRAGVVRLGIVGRKTFALFEEPLRVLRMSDGGEWGLQKMSVGGVVSGETDSIAQWMADGDLPAAPGDRRWGAAGPSYAAPFSVCYVGGDAWSLLDVRRGEFVRLGVSSVRTTNRVRAHALCTRMSEARALAGAVAGSP